MTTAAVVLAAGAATRFGAPKQLAELEGRPLVGHVVGAALDSGVDEVVVVLGAAADDVRGALPDDGRVRAVVNERHARGQATSVTAGIGALGKEVEVAVVLLADQPRVAAEAIRAVVAAVRIGAPVARARYDDGPSHPVAFHRSVWPRLMELTGDEGARQVLTQLDVGDVTVPGTAPRDVDRPDDLRRLRSAGPR